MTINNPTPVNKPGVTLKPGPVSLGPHQPDVLTRINPGGTIMRVQPTPIVDPILPVQRVGDKRQDRRELRRAKKHTAYPF